MKNPKISVIVTVYNIENYIEQCLVSIADQSFRDFECIVVDDGSSDTSVSVIRKTIREDKRFKLISKENGGVSTARNAGFDVAKGEYTIFLDGDDFFENSLLSELVSVADSNNAEITVCSFVPYYDRMKKTGESKIDFSVFNKSNTVSYKTHPEHFFSTLTFMFWNKLIRTDFLKKYDIRNNEKLHRAQDIEFIGRALVSAQRIAYIQKDLVYYRTDMTDSNVKRLYRYPKDVIYALTLLKEYLEEKRVYKKLEGEFVTIAIDHLLANLYFTEIYAVHKDVYKNAKAFLSSIGASKYVDKVNNKKTANEVSMLLEGTYEDWLRFRIQDLRDDSESKHISYLLSEFKRKYEEELSAKHLLEQSFSWKITKPLRAMKRFQRHK